MLISEAIPEFYLMSSEPKGIRIIQKIHSSLYKEGETPNALFLIIQGKVSVFRKNALGRDIRLPDLKKGTFVGIQSLFGPTTTSHSARVTRSARLLVIPLVQIAHFMKRWPALREEIMAQLIQRIDLLNKI